jgi:hypothetical protein
MNFADAVETCISVAALFWVSSLIVWGIKHVIKK